MLSTEYNPSVKSLTIQQHLDTLFENNNISLGFNSSRINLNRVITIPPKGIKVEKLVSEIFKGENIKLVLSENKILIVFKEQPKESKTIRGIIRDKETGEVLVGASVLEKYSGASTFSNQVGFYSLSIPIDSNTVVFNYLGYNQMMFSNIDVNKKNVALEFNNEMKPIVISDKISDNFSIGSGAQKIDFVLTEGFQTATGDNDLINAVRIDAGAQSGNEGQGSLYVRGGSPDQNLILLDGIPLYEVSHTAGLSSTFIEESIHSAQFISNGFPARYAGRLSSVLDVKLKDGNKGGYHGNVNVSLPAIKGHLEGPLLSDKTTFNISARGSYIDTYIDDLFDGVINYDDIGINYHDIVAKIRHQISPSRKFTMSFYDGNDDLSFFRTNEVFAGDGKFESSIKNKLNWGSRLWNFGLDNILSDKLQLSFNLGSVEYEYNSRGSFTFLSEVDNLTSYQELDVISHSQIKDYVFRTNIDYYATDHHRLKLGGSLISHSFNPAVRQNIQIIDGQIDSLNSADNRFRSLEYNFYIEDTYTPSKLFEIYGGLNYSGYTIGLTRYRSLQPRVSTVIKPDAKNRITFSYTKMTQFIHLLVNPGIGLPSDLWVPSTDDILPEFADQLSLSYNTLVLHPFELSVSGYIKWLDNLLDYRTPVDLFFTVVNTDNPPIIEDDSDWQTRVVEGSGRSMGLEFQIRKTKGALTGWLSYALSKSTRNFPQLNGGRDFPYRFDRRNDFNTGLKYQINTNWSIAANWVYGTGNAFSLALESFDTVFGIELLNSDERNNYRYPAYHHLDIQGNYKKQFKNNTYFNFQLGLSNVYNRRNAYYIYILENPVTQNTEARKTTLFPILPSINLEFGF